MVLIYKCGRCGEFYFGRHLSLPDGDGYHYDLCPDCHFRLLKNLWEVNEDGSPVTTLCDECGTLIGLHEENQYYIVHKDRKYCEECISYYTEQGD